MDWEDNHTNDFKTSSSSEEYFDTDCTLWGYEPDYNSYQGTVWFGLRCTDLKCVKNTIESLVNYASSLTKNCWENEQEEEET